MGTLKTKRRFQGGSPARATASAKTDLYERINQLILEKLRQGTAPWKMSCSSYGPVRNYVSGKRYRGINALLLGCMDYEYPLFMTFNQVKTLGGTLKKGSKSIPVVYWKRLVYASENGNSVVQDSEKENDDVKVVPFLKYYNVFNIACVEGVDFKLPAKSIAHDPIESCERIISRMPTPPVIRYTGNQPCYIPALDEVRVPPISRFDSAGEFYNTLYHELSHATGHTSRLDRPTLTTPAKYGSEAYSKEELVAEIAACFLCGHAGIDCQILENSVSYIGHWLNKLTGLLEENHKFFVQASAQAQKAADYILNAQEDVDADETDTSPD